jgi:uncharacterized protein YvpB
VIPKIERRAEFKVAIIILLVLSISLPVHSADIYRWVDKEGVLHFSDDQPQGVKDTKRLKVEDSAPRGEVPGVKLEVPGEKVTTPRLQEKKEWGRITTRTQQKLQNFPLVFQKFNWCSYASMEMVFKYYGFDVNQDAIFKNLNARRRSTVKEGEGLDPRTVARFMSRAGLNVDYHEEGDLEAVKSYIDKGIPVMCGRIAPGKWEGSRHMAVIIGYDDVYKSVVLADPGYGREISIGYDEFMNEWGRANRPMIAVSK